MYVSGFIFIFFLCTSLSLSLSYYVPHQVHLYLFSCEPPLRLYALLTAPTFCLMHNEQTLTVGAHKTYKRDLWHNEHTYIDIHCIYEINVKAKFLSKLHNAITVFSKENIPQGTSNLRITCFWPNTLPDNKNSKLSLTLPTMLSCLLSVIYCYRAVSSQQAVNNIFPKH